MTDSHKAVFLPANKQVLNNFKGYIPNGELLTISESDLFTDENYSEYDDSKPFSVTEKIIRGVLIVPLIFILPIILIIASLFKRYEEAKDGTMDLLNKFMGILFKKKKVLKSRRTTVKKYEAALFENIPDFLYHCKNSSVRVYLYSYQYLSIEEQKNVNKQIEAGLITSCHTISKLVDLKFLLESENISIHNSLFVILDSTEKHEARLLGFQPESVPERNVELLKERDFKGEGELEWNSYQTIRELKGKIEYYLRAKNSAFFTDNLILFIEDKKDEYLNNYILKNYKRISQDLDGIGMKLMYFPLLQAQNNNIIGSVIEFIRYRNPVLYSLSNAELTETLQLLLSKISPQEFYSMTLEELQLSFFKRPCLLRKFTGSFDDKNKFTYAPITYQTETDLDNFFSWYCKQLKKAQDREQPQYRMVQPPSEYDADWHFGTEGKEISLELKQKIDSLKDEGKYGALVEAIMYMLETIKEEKPEIIDKVRPLLEKRKLLESKVVLSPIVIDKHYNIFLPAFGNQEVKMHALPKTVYLLFLRYPKGIRFKELYMYKAELLEIYNKVTNKYEREEIQRAIDDLVDMTKPSINQKCARIREAFRTIMDEHVAKHYYIDGTNGEPKSIALPTDLITIQK